MSAPKGKEAEKGAEKVSKKLAPVPVMDLKGVRSVSDKGNHFLIEHEKHGPFKVAKSALAPHLAKRVAAMCKGGEVQHFSGESGNPTDQVVQPAAIPGVDYSNYGGDPSTGSFSVSHMLGLDKPAAVPANNTSLFGGRSPDDQIAARRAKAEQVAKDATAAKEATLERDPAARLLGAASTVPGAAQNPDPAARAPSGGSGLDQAALDAQLKANAAAAAQGQPSQPESLMHQTATAQIKAPGLGGVFGAIGQQEQAAKEAAKAAAEQEAGERALREAAAKQEAVKDQAFQNTMAAQEADYQQRKAAVDAAEVDPQHYWHSMSTGGKISSAIGILLSGIGAGLAHQSNMAMDVVQKNIDRDIDAQKVDLGKKESQLAENLRKTGDLRAAYNMTKAQALNNLQLQIQSNAAKFGGAKAQAQADMLIGQLEEKKKALAYEAALRVSATAAQQAQEAQINDAYGKAFAGTAGPEEEALIRKVNPKMGDLFVPTEGNFRGLARGEESAKNYKEARTSILPALDIVRKLQRADKELTLADKVSPTPEARARRREIESQAEALRLQLPSALAELKRLNGPEFDTATKLAPNPTDVLGAPGFSGRYRALADMLEDKWRTVGDTHLTRIPQRPPG